MSENRLEMLFDNGCKKYERKMLSFCNILCSYTALMENRKILIKRIILWTRLQY